MQFGPNLNEFVRRFDVETTNGQGKSYYKSVVVAGYGGPECYSRS